MTHSPLENFQRVPDAMGLLKSMLECTPMRVALDCALAKMALAPDTTNEMLKGAHRLISNLEDLAKPITEPTKLPDKSGLPSYDRQ